MRHERIGRTEKHAGAMALELLVALPLLLLTLLAGIDFARCAHVLMRVSSATEAGLAVAGQHGFCPATQSRWEKAIRQAARDHLVAIADFDESQMEVKITAPSGVAGQASVAVSYPFRTIIAWPGFARPLILRHAGAVTQVRE